MNTSIAYDQIEMLSKAFNALVISNEADALDDECIDKFNLYFKVDNEIDALQIFEEQEIDLIFLDADSPKIHWNSLVHKFRQRVYDIPIALMMKFDSPEQVSTAFAMGIDQCLFKPLFTTRIQHVLCEMVSRLQYKKDAKEIFWRKEKEKQKFIATTSASDIIQGIPFPIFAFKREEILFANKNLHSLLMSKNIASDDGITLDKIESLFDNITNHTHFSQIREGKNLDVRYHYNDKGLKKVFIPTKFTIAFEPNYEVYTVIVLQDIASHLMQIKMLAYQKNKVESYKEVIEELLARRISRKCDQEFADALLENDEPIYTETSTLQDALSDKDIQLLRKSVQMKITANDYITNVDESSYEEINELPHITQDLQTAIDYFTQEPTPTSIHEIARLFDVYGAIINRS